MKKVMFLTTFYLWFLWENEHLGFGYFLFLDQLVTAPRSVTKSDSGCYYVAITGISRFPRARILISQSYVSHFKLISAIFSISQPSKTISIQSIPAIFRHFEPYQPFQPSPAITNHFQPIQAINAIFSNSSKVRSK